MKLVASPLKMREVSLLTDNRSVLIIASLVGVVVARFANDHAILERVGSSKFRVTNVMGMRDFTKRMIRTSGFTKSLDVRAT